MDKPKYRRHQFTRGAISPGDEIVRKGDTLTVLGVWEEDDVTFLATGGDRIALREGDEYRTPPEDDDEIEDEYADERQEIR